MSFNFYNSKASDPNFIGMKKFFNELTSINNLGWKFIEESPITTQMDIFFICVLVGLKKNVKENTIGYEKEEFVKDYIASYRNYSDFINGLYLALKVENDVTQKDNKDEVRQLMRVLIDPNDKINDLNTKSLADLNSYALGGYIEILKKFNYTKPGDISTFFGKFIELII